MFSNVQPFSFLYLQQELMLGAGQSPLSHHKSYVIRSPLAGDRFKSPVVTHLARRQLFSGM
jgi:hypothetical protein